MVHPQPGSIAAYSRPPYELSFKENGCIIFISALSSHQLIVTSKHSLGANESHSISHAQKGEEWLNRHLQSVNKTRKDLAQRLWDQDETAVAELCDDSFEEHVLAYPLDRSGLHLHGLNANSAQFQTRSMKEVEEFARQWGFLPTRYLEFDSMEKVNEFTSTIAETGKWQGIAIEGFVVRTRIPSNQDVVEIQKSKTVVAPPYAPGQTWFYKVKFDEPYLMYREWRELARRMLSEKEAYEKAPHVDESKKPELPKVKKRRPETQLFIEWCYVQLYGNQSTPAKPELFHAFQHNTGIIRMRELFIKYMNSEEGRQELKKWQGMTTSWSTSSTKEELPFTKTLLVPIAIPGCGKTALAISMTYLFPCIGHTQSDNVQTKKTGPTFLKNILKELDEHDVVFADRNNHLFKHRNEIVKCIADWEKAPLKKVDTNPGKKKKKGADPEWKDVNEKASTDEIERNNRHVRLVAIVWPIDDLPLNLVHHLCSDRVVERGANHQSLRVESGKEHEQVLWHFLQTRESFRNKGDEYNEEGAGDDAFDLVIELDIQSTLDTMVQTTVRQLAPLLNMPLPSNEQIRCAVAKAKQYRVNIIKEIKTAPGPPIRYYGLSIEADLIKVLQPVLEEQKEAQKALNKLVEAKRFIAQPHVTLVHNSELKANITDDNQDMTTAQIEAQERWDFYRNLYLESKTAAIFTLHVDCVAWNDRAMSLGICRIFNKQHPTLETFQGKEWRPHITLGTFHEDIRPYEGNRILCEADSGSSNVSCYHFSEPLCLSGRVRGLR